MPVFHLGQQRGLRRELRPSGLRQPVRQAAPPQRFARCRTAHSPVQRQLPRLGQIGVGLKAPQSRSAVLPAPARQNRTRLHPDPVQNPRPGDQQLHRADQPAVVGPVKTAGIGQRGLRIGIVHHDRKLIVRPAAQPGGQFQHKRRVAGAEMPPDLLPVQIHDSRVEGSAKPHPHPAAPPGFGRRQAGGIPAGAAVLFQPVLHIPGVGKVYRPAPGQAIRRRPHGKLPVAQQSFHPQSSRGARAHPIRLSRSGPCF